MSSDGSIDQILPNEYTSGDNFIKAGSVKTFPDKGDKFVYPFQSKPQDFVSRR
ncbi:hypothetical protein GCM10022631_02500 [Deinococcus rubellus]